MTSNTLAILKNRLKLERMISMNENYDKILVQSQKLDKFINIEMRAKLNKNNFAAKREKDKNH